MVNGKAKAEHPDVAVSVIIPTFNHAQFVMQTIESVFGQSFKNCEVIVVNDGSSDDTAMLLRPLHDAGRIQYIEQANAGQGAARNRGLLEARGEFVAFLDDDDLWPEGKLEWQVEALRENKQAVVVAGQRQAFGNSFAGALSRDEQFNRSLSLARVTYEDFATGNVVVVPGQTLIRASALKTCGGLDASLSGSDDWDLWLRLAQLGPILLADRIALFYRRHAANASSNFGRMNSSCWHAVRKHFGRIPQRNRIGLWFRVRCFTKVYLWGTALEQSKQSARAGHFWRATGLFFRALWLRPIATATLFSRRWAGNLRDRLFE